MMLDDCVIKNLVKLKVVIRSWNQKMIPSSKIKTEIILNVSLLLSLNQQLLFFSWCFKFFYLFFVSTHQGGLNEK